jgi:hypothetical protein
MIFSLSKIWLFTVFITIVLYVTFFSYFNYSSITPLILYFAWLTVEDLIRKLWGNDIIIYFGKFFLMLPIIVQILKARQKEKYSLHPIIQTPLIVWISIVLLNSFNPNLVHPLEALLGIHSDLLYLLIFLPAGYYLVRSPQKVATLFTFLCILAIFPTIVGIIQHTVSPTFLNERVLVGTELRPFIDRGKSVLGKSYFQVSSVFVDPGRFANYSEMIFLVSVGMVLLFSEHKWYSLVGWIGVGIAALDILLSAKKRVFIVTLLTLSLFLGLVNYLKVERKFRIGTIPVRWLPLTAVVIAIAYVVAAEPIEKGVKYFSTTILGTEGYPSELSRRLPGYVHQLAMIPYFGLLGRGTGVASLGKQYFFTRFGISVSPYVSENGFTDKAYAYGIVGLAVWLWLLGAILVALWDVSKNIPYSPYKAFVILIFSWATIFFTAAQLLGSHFIQDYLNQSYYWMLIGCALSCPYWVIKPSTNIRREL